VPLKNAMEGDGVRWWGGAYDVAAVAGRCVRETRGRGGGLGRNAKPSRRGSVSGAPLQIAVAGYVGRSRGGAYNVAMVVGVACSRNAGPKNRNRAARAQFRAYRWKMRWGGDGVRLWGGAYDVATGLRQWVGAIG
jgi:hypothetical protein